MVGNSFSMHSVHSHSWDQHLGVFVMNLCSSDTFLFTCKQIYRAGSYLSLLDSFILKIHMVHSKVSQVLHVLAEGSHRPCYTLRLIHNRVARHCRFLHFNHMTTVSHFFCANGFCQGYTTFTFLTFVNHHQADLR